MVWLEAFEHVAIIVASVVAIFGINAWRREHVGKRQVELAEETLALFYQAADAIRYMRSPAGFGHETEDVKRLEGEADDRFEARKKASVVFYRYKQNQEVFSKLYAARYRFMTLIGKEEAKPFEDVRKITNKIISSASMLAMLWARSYHRTDEQSEQHWERIGRHEAIFWEGLEDEDPINPKLKQAVSDIETTCRSIIAGEIGFLSKRQRRRAS